MENTFKIDTEYKKCFEYRIDCMLQLLNLNKVDSIIDLGCGLQTLKNKIPQSIQYTGVDLYKHMESTIQVDFNKGEFYNEEVDIIFCSGIFEYIYDLKTFIKKIGNNTNIVIGSYHFFNNTKNRPESWVNSLTYDEFYNMWYNIGYYPIFLCNTKYFNHPFLGEQDDIFILINNKQNNEIINYATINIIEFRKNFILYNSKLNKIDYNFNSIINTLSWWIPIKKWRDNFRNSFIK